MKTLPREPWRGGQICGYQTNVGGWSEGSPEFCGEFKMLGSPLCSAHDAELRVEHDGRLPRFAPGNALGLALTHSVWGWSVWDEFGELCASASDRAELEESYGFTLKWEPYDDTDDPIPATGAEIAAWKGSGS